MRLNHNVIMGYILHCSYKFSQPIFRLRSNYETYDKVTKITTAIMKRRLAFYCHSTRINSKRLAHDII